jgi:TonB family protein
MRTRRVDALSVKYLAIGIFCLAVATSASYAEAQDRNKLENDLKHTFEHNLFSLKTPYFGSKLQFDSLGNLIGNAVAGPWSTCGVLQVGKLVISSDHLEIEGKRVILALRSRESKKEQSSPPQAEQITPIVTGNNLRILVNISSLDASEVNRTLSQVFRGGQLAERMAAFWKPATADFEAFRRNTPNAIIGELEGKRPVYLGKNGVVQPPKLTHTEDPMYTDAARRKNLQGTAVLMVVVNENGFPEVLEVTRGLGEGLDIQALSAVAGWRFNPALKDGQPVAVLINVEVTFHF